MGQDHSLPYIRGIYIASLAFYGHACQLKSPQTLISRTSSKPIYYTDVKCDQPIFLFKSPKPIPIFLFFFGGKKVTLPIYIHTIPSQPFRPRHVIVDVNPESTQYFRPVAVCCIHVLGSIHRRYVLLTTNNPHALKRTSQKTQSSLKKKTVESIQLLISILSLSHPSPWRLAGARWDVIKYRHLSPLEH